MSASVSVVIPCYKCASVLERATASVFAQTQLPAELILVDDASPDDGATRGRIEKVTAGARGIIPVRSLLLDRNVGPGGARNAGWSVASGEYVAFLDADDAWHPRKIEIQYAWMKGHPICDLSSHNSLEWDDRDQLATDLSPRPPSRRAVLSSMLFKNAILTRTVMLRRSLTERFANGARFSEDYALWMEMLTAGRWLEQLDADLAYSFRPAFDAAGQSGRLWEMERSELAIYRGLARSSKIGWPMASAAMGFSLLKFVRRLAARALR